MSKYEWDRSIADQPRYVRVSDGRVMATITREADDPPRFSAWDGTHEIDTRNSMKDAESSVQSHFDREDEISEWKKRQCIDELIPILNLCMPLVIDGVLHLHVKESSTLNSIMVTREYGDESRVLYASWFGILWEECARRGWCVGAYSGRTQVVIPNGPDSIGGMGYFGEGTDLLALARAFAGAKRAQKT